MNNNSNIIFILSPIVGIIILLISFIFKLLKNFLLYETFLWTGIILIVVGIIYFIYKIVKKKNPFKT